MPAIRPIRFLVAALFAVIVLLLALEATRTQAQSIDEEKYGQGARLYQENCAVCHGQNGEGRVGATLAQDWPSIRPSAAVETVIRQGVEGSVMPAWSQENGGPLAEEQIDNLVAFILSREGVEQVSGEQEPVNTPVIPWLSGWGGVLLAFGLFTVLVALALIAQRR